MTFVIHKEPVDVYGETRIYTREGARFLDIQPQGPEQRAMLWMLVDLEKPEVVRTIRVVGTGQEFTMPAHAEYLKTVQVHGGLVLHLFW